MKPRKERPEAGTIADAVLSTIELIAESGKEPITRQTVYQRCELDNIRMDDVHLRMVYLQKKGYIRPKQRIARLACVGPRAITEYELTPPSPIAQALPVLQRLRQQMRRLEERMNRTSLIDAPRYM